MKTLKQTTEEIIGEFRKNFYTLDETVSPPRILCHGEPQQMTDFIQEKLQAISHQTAEALKLKKINHTKENGERENKNHGKDEYWGCCECYEDSWYNKSLADIAQKKKEWFGEKD
jgi:hypothetical protein